MVARVKSALATVLMRASIEMASFCWAAMHPRSLTNQTFERISFETWVQLQNQTKRRGLDIVPSNDK